ncbi:hypothetical protein ALMP_49580 [Streptomyces sp. A012304]|nr:hypothetical protein ALMP_49580 [Streptomyces sp. A012304]
MAVMSDLRTAAPGVPVRLGTLGALCRSAQCCIQEFYLRSEPGPGREEHLCRSVDVAPVAFSVSSFHQPDTVHSARS